MIYADKGLVSPAFTNNHDHVTLQKLANQSVSNSTLVMEMVSNSFSESKGTFCLIKRETI